MRILVLLLVAGVVEIAVLVALGNVMGVLPTFGLLIAAAVLGSWLVRREGRRTLREFRDAVGKQRPPEKELSDGVLIAAAGILILLPGFISDVLGLLILLPPVRAVLRKRMLRAAERRAKQMQDRVWLHAQEANRRQGGTPGSDVIDGEVVSVTDDDEPAPGESPRVLPSQAEPPDGRA